MLYKVAIIGSGIIGLNTAYYLLKKNYKVEIFSPCKTQQEFQPTSNAAIVASVIKGLNVARTKFFQEKIDGHFALAKLAEELKIKLNYGAHEYFFSNEDESRIKKRIFKKEFFGTLNIDKSHLLDRPMYLRSSVFGKFIYHDDYFLDSQELLLKLKDECKNLGAIFHNDSIENIDLCDSRPNKLKLISKKDLYEYNTAIVATGEQTYKLLKKFQSTLPLLQKIAGHTLVFKGSNTQKPEMIVDGKKTCVIKEGKIYFGSSSIKLTDNRNADSILLKKSEKELIAEFYKTYCFSERDNPLLESRYGVRVKISGNEPIIKCLYEHEDSKLIAAFGFYKNGFQLAVSTAKKIEKMIGKN